jgi:alpha-L-fucosidase
MKQHLTQFFHFGLPTFWDPPIEYLYTANPTYHNCQTTSIDHGNQTGAFYPCLDPVIFNPTDFSAEDWMAHAVALGTDEICLTAHHEGGFALWPTNYSAYSVKLARNWRGGNGDVLREFADAANRWGVKICYYLNVAADGYETLVRKATPEQYIAGQLGMLREVLTQYGPVNRLWQDGTASFPSGTNLTQLWAEVYNTIRTVSPATLISPYRGDVCASIGSLYTSNGPTPNSTDTSTCVKASEDGKHFYPTEMHGITAQMGPNGNTGTTPTYWFWHPWACAQNISGCPWVGHTNASRLFDSYLTTVGHGAILNFNAPAERTGRMNASLAAVMHEVGGALNATFRAPPLAGVYNVSVPCTQAAVELALPGDGGQAFDYVVSREDLSRGQRVANYSFEYQAVGSSAWQVLVPPVFANGTHGLGDRPDGNDPRDQYIGRYRIDQPVANVSASAGAEVKVARLRFNCLRALWEPINLLSIEVRIKQVTW